ncbi:MAG: DHH family phosphoesterase [Bacteroidota bacterium]
MLHSTTFEDSLKAIRSVLKTAKNAAITTHVNPDGDAIGSTLGLYHFLKQLDIDARVINCSPTPYNFEFLPGAREIEVYNQKKHNGFLNSTDLLFVLDANSASRLQNMEEIVLKSPARKIIIDHHLNPEEFADIYAIDTDASSTAELVWKLIHSHETAHITTQIAPAIYTGILTDTGSFKFPRTTAEVHRIIANLIECGAEPFVISNEIYNTAPFEKTLLLGEALAGLKLYFGGKFCVMTISQELFKKTGTTEQDVEGLVHHTLGFNGAQLGLLMTETENLVKLSFRSKGDVPAHTLAGAFGGGGHFNAAGARVEGKSLKEVLEEVLKIISADVFPE